jgi:hypothetical protein
MKLYTEEQLRKTWNEGFRQGMSIDDENYEPVFFEHYLKFLIPIELPSDEEIENGYEPKTMYDLGYLDGAKWMRDKILQGSNK